MLHHIFFIKNQNGRIIRFGVIRCLLALWGLDRAAGGEVVEVSVNPARPPNSNHGGSRDKSKEGLFNG